MDSSKINKEIAEYGLSVIALEATDYLPAFAHSIGLWKNYQHPEIIIFGLPLNILHNVLNEAGAFVKSGKKLETSQIYTDFFENGHAYFVAVDHKNLSDYFGHGIALNEGNPFPAMQLVWTDRNYKFPWDETFEEEFKFKQPLLDRNAAFKFLEEQELEVFTSADYMEPEAIIVKVIHKPDGEWLFLTSSNEVQTPTSLGAIIAQDATINDLFDLDYGQCAERKSINEQWKRTLIS